MDKKILEKINDSLGKEFIIVKQFGNGIANLNYLLQSDGGEKIVARILKEQKPENIAAEAKMQNELQKNSLGTSVLMSNDSGKPLLLKIQDTYITFTPFLESAPIDEFSDTLLIDLGGTIAKFQIALKNLKHDLTPPNYLSPLYQSKLIFQSKDIETSELIKQEIAKLLLELKSYKLPQSLIHGDLNSGNILQIEDSIIAVLDLETVEYTYRILDPAVAIYYRAVDKGRNYKIVRDLVLQGYEKLIHLSEKEKEAMPLAVRYAAACLSLWSLANEPGDNSGFLKGFQDLQQRIRKGFEIN